MNVVVLQIQTFETILDASQCSISYDRRHRIDDFKTFLCKSDLERRRNCRCQSFSIVSNNQLLQQILFDFDFDHAFTSRRRDAQRQYTLFVQSDKRINDSEYDHKDD
jgi:hypothetical protein